MFKAEQLVDNSFGREAKITEKAIKKKSKQQIGLLSQSRRLHLDCICVLLLACFEIESPLFF